MNEPFIQTSHNVLIEQLKKNANYRMIVSRLCHLLESGIISRTEYDLAKVYYQHLLGANLIITN